MKKDQASALGAYALTHATTQALALVQVRVGGAVNFFFVAVVARLTVVLVV